MSDFSSFKKDLQELSRLEANKKMLLAGLFIFIFVISVIVGQNITKKSTTSTTNEAMPQNGSVSQKPTTTLSITPGSGTLSVGKQSKMSVLLAKLPVTAIKVTLVYDPKILSVSTIENGGLFQKIVRQKIDNGTVTFAATVLPDKANNLNEGIVVSFMVKPLKAVDSTVIAFDTKDTTTALNGENTLGSATGGSYKVTK